MRVLIIEDEQRLAATIADLICSAGYKADNCYDGEEGLELACSDVFDAIVLDVMLPGMDGFEIVKKMRMRNARTPVLMVTARSQVTDRVKGLELGADYYLTKPFDNAEFLACLGAVMRRQGEIQGEVMNFGDLELDLSVSQLRSKEHSVSLSARELDLMRLLIVNSSQLLSKETILLKVWGYDADINDNSVEAYISFLRKKLALLESPVQIMVVRKIGYRLEAQAS